MSQKIIDTKKLITWVLFLLIGLTAIQWFTKAKETPLDQVGAPFTISSLDSEYVVGQEVKVKITNNTDAPLKIPSTCPKNPLKVEVFNGEIFAEKVASTSVSCDQVKEITIPAKSDATISFNFWNNALFGTPGRYKVEMTVPVDGKETTISTPEFTSVEAGIFRTAFRKVFYQPLYNLLILFIKVGPGHSLGFAIILLTVLIRVLLLAPSQRAIVSQRRMQELQPKLEEIKKKYAGNQERIAQETMTLWKEHKVNPFGTCLPILIQFPVLIALFYVIQNGLNPDNAYLLYGPLKNTDLTTIQTNFLGILDLTHVNKIVLPLIVGLLQFAQLKLATWKKKKDAGDKPAQTPSSEMEIANKSMTYVMPVMIALFTSSVPAGVGLYWAVSTLFGLGQQVVANKKVS